MYSPSQGGGTSVGDRARSCGSSRCGGLRQSDLGHRQGRHGCRDRSVDKHWPRAETDAEYPADNEDGDAAPKSVHWSLSRMVVRCQSAVFKRSARTAATASDSAIPATHTAHPTRSKI